MSTKAIVIESNLPVFSADQGWQPLCDFLIVGVLDTGFPRVNGYAELKKLIGKAL